MKKLLFFFVLLAAAGCNPVAKFEIVDVDKPRMQGLTGLRGEVVVDNDGRKDLLVEEAEFAIYLKGRKVATARLVEPIFVPAREVSRIDYRLRLTDISLGALGGLSLDSADQVTLDIDGRMRLGRVNKKIKLKKVSLSQIIYTFDR